MTNLETYLEDGANHQARAVLMFMQHGCGIEASWNTKGNFHDANIKVGRWENCREQGYILSLKSKNRKKQLNIAFFEHRNSDSIHAVKWEQFSRNTINIENATFSANEYGEAFAVSYGQIVEMAEWLQKEFESFYAQ